MDIKGIVEKVIRKVGSNDPFRIAKEKGILVFYDPIPENVLGYFNEKYRIKMIHLNQNLNEQLRLFVCAHELGHAILHHDINTPCLRDALYSTDRIERQANIFAIELLLPDNYLKEYADFGTYDLAKIFNIPKELVELKFS